MLGIFACHRTTHIGEVGRDVAAKFRDSRNKKDLPDQTERKRGDTHPAVPIVVVALAVLLIAVAIAAFAHFAETVRYNENNSGSDEVISKTEPERPPDPPDWSQDSSRFDGAPNPPPSDKPDMSFSNEFADASLKRVALDFAESPSGTAVQSGAQASGATSAPATQATSHLSHERYQGVLMEPTYARFTLSAVGDNLMNMPVVYSADANAGTMNDGWYDFTPMYSGVADIVSGHDLNFIDIETILGGDYLGLSGYPVFNSPSAIAAQVEAFGWNLASTASNHSYDMGMEGILNSSATWAQHPNVTETGTFVSVEDRATIRVREVNGARVAFLAYTDYLNGYVLPDDQWYAVSWVHYGLMAEDIARAHELADVVIVAMSWGDENSTWPNDFQFQTAQFLANQNVDLILGFGPHVIEPVMWLSGYDEAGNPTGHQTFCVFSLGNFLSNQPLAIENVEGCFSCTFTVVPSKRGSSDGVQLSGLTWTPLVNHIDGDWHQVFKLKDYTVDLAYAHDSIGLEADPFAYPYDITYSIIDPAVVSIDV